MYLLAYHKERIQRTIKRKAMHHPTSHRISGTALSYNNNKRSSVNSKMCEDKDVFITAAITTTKACYALSYRLWQKVCNAPCIAYRPLCVFIVQLFTLQRFIATSRPYYIQKQTQNHKLIYLQCHNRIVYYHGYESTQEPLFK